MMCSIIRCGIGLIAAAVIALPVAAEEATAMKVVQVPAHELFRAATMTEVDAAFDSSLAAHPRLLLTDEKMAEVRKKIARDSRWSELFEELRKVGDSLSERSVLERKLEGKRLLDVSRDGLHRIFTWAFLYRYTHEQKYADRAEREMLAIADFSDWNPSHFLDTAEMTTAMAIGYDSFYSVLSDESKSKIRTAILEKGIGPSLERSHQHWFRNTANWNQVCHAGMLYGALAIAEEDPQFAREVTLRSVNGITWSMSAYEPDGNYTEGPGYWGYGTSFNILLIAGLQTAIGTDFGRGDANGFLKSIDYYEHAFGTTGLVYNYPDCGGGRIFEPTVFWFVEKFNDPSKAWNEAKMLFDIQFSQIAQSRGPNGNISMSRMVGHRLIPCAFLWGAIGVEDSGYDGRVVALPDPPKELGFVGIGDGRNPVAMFRTCWGARWGVGGAYLGIKAGSPSAPHGHMDVGSFVYDRGLVRWAAELGPESYHEIESRGMNLWSTAQNSDRWRLYRYNNFSHNTLTINGAKQIAAARCSFARTQIASGDIDEEGWANASGPSSAVMDLTPMYQEEIGSIVRTATLLPNGDLTILDEIQSLPEKSATVEWRMVTPASVEIAEDGRSAILRQSDPLRGKGEDDKILTLALRTECEWPVAISTAEAKGPEEFDSRNSGWVITVKIEVPAGETAHLKVCLE